MKLLSKSYDGGPDSGVTGYWLIECKPLMSIVLLHFSPGSRDAYHSHAFNAITLWLKGRVVEEYLEDEEFVWNPGNVKFTARETFHRVIAGSGGAWALSVRGPWRDSWREFKNDKFVRLTHGRRVLR